MRRAGLTTTIGRSSIMQGGKRTTLATFSWTIVLCVGSTYPSRMPQGTESTEEERLVSGVLAKDRKATAEFVSLCADWLYPFLRRRLVPRVDMVEDLMQEILLAAWQALPNFRGEANLRGWVLGIARHKLDDY